MNKYDESFDPPAPIAVVALRNIATGERTESVYVQLDTGADVSLLPLRVIETLQIEPSGEPIKLVGFDKNESVSEAYNLQIIFLGKRLTGDYCAVAGEIGILGRDVLNEFSIIFDGGNLEWRKQD